MSERTPFDDFCALLSPCELCDGTGKYSQPTVSNTMSAVAVAVTVECPLCGDCGACISLDLEVAKRVFDRLAGEGCAPIDVAIGCTCKPSENTGGGHSPKCPAAEPECTCYEVIGGHQMGCAFYGRTG